MGTTDADERDGQDVQQDPADPTHAPWQEERARREAALRALAHAAAQPTPPAGVSTPTTASTRPLLPSLRPRARRPLRRWQIALSVVLLVAVLGSSVALYLHSRSSSRPPSTHLPPIPTKLSINVFLAHVVCPSSVRWSPDGLRLAVLGVSGNDCGAGDPSSRPPVVGIFDARNGTLVRLIHPMQALARYPQLVAMGLSALLATPLSWTPDGKRLLFQITVDDGTVGLLVAPLDGAAPQLYPATLAVGQRSSTNPVTPPGSPIVWDLATHTLVPATASAPYSTALAYGWTQAGGITPAMPLPGDTRTLTGSPVQRTGSTTFSLWQPGTIEADLSQPPVPCPPCLAAVSMRGTLAPAITSALEGPRAPGPPTPIALTYHSEPDQWSPDGHFVTFGFPANARLAWPDGRAPVTLDPQTCSLGNSFGNSLGNTDWLCGEPLTPLPDRALAALAATALAGRSVTYPYAPTPLIEYDPIPVAWRPDGKVLAAILPGDAFGGQNGTGADTITLYDTATGSRLSTVASPRPLSTSGYFVATGESPFQWSPTGAQLALADMLTSQVTIWGPGQLPA